MTIMFDYEHHIKQRPSFAQRDEFYGSYRYTDLAGGWVKPDPVWEQENLVYIPVRELSGFPLLYGVPNPAFTRVRIHRKVEQVFRATWNDIVELGLHKKLYSFDGIYAARHMHNNPNLPLSNHAKGSAIDFDQATNRPNIPFAAMGFAKKMDFVVEMERRGWAWGGRWAQTDGMHFEWVDQDPRCVPRHQDSIIHSVPKTANNPQALELPLDVEFVIVNGVVQSYQVAKATKVGKKLFINTVTNGIKTP